MFILQLLFCFWLSLSLIKEIYVLQFIALNTKRAWQGFFVIYFSSAFFYSSSPLFPFLVFGPCFLLVIAFFLLKKQAERKLLLELYALLKPLEFRMKSGDSFLSAWEKSLQELSPSPSKKKIQTFNELFKFQKKFSYPEDKEVERFVKELLLIGQSPQPLSRLSHLQRKVRVELRFRVKSHRALLQVRAQSVVIMIFYVALLIGTFFMYSTQYLLLTFLSFILFLIGLFWVFNLGRRMKWSL